MKENKIIIITTILNFIVATIKLVSGFVFSFSTLIADSIQSFIDFITDITSLIANKIGKRRANKTYPFGYGQVYYLANLFTGILLFLIGIFILYECFFFNAEFVPNLKIAIILLITIALKLLVVHLLKSYGKTYKSELLIESSIESKADFISTCVVLVVLLISFLEEYIPSFINIDKIGSFGMALYVFYTSIKMIISNIRGILLASNDVENTELKEKIIEQLKSFKKIEVTKIKAVNMSAYYGVFIQIKVNEKLSIKQYIALEKKIRDQLKAKNKKLKFIDIEPI